MIKSFEVIGLLPHYSLVYTGLKPLTIREAWLVTLAKWRFLDHWHRQPENIPAIYDGAEETCGLCMITACGTAKRPMNKRCPLGVVGCADTPYYDYHHARQSDSPGAKHAYRERLYLLRQYKKWREAHPLQ